MQFLKFFFVPALLLSSNTFALALVNGDFSSDLSGWNNAGATDATVNAGVAELSTQVGDGINPYSSVLVQGDDGSFTFGSPVVLGADIETLIFDIRFDQFDDSLEAGFSSFDDSLTVALYDELDFSGSSDLIFSSGSDFSAESIWQTVELDVTALAGHTLALSFELFDESNGFDSTFYLDNINFLAAEPPPEPPVSVSEPSSLMLLLIGIVGMFARRRHFKK